MAGRRAKPTKLRILEGNRSKTPLPRGEPQPAQELPAPPAHLTAIALAEWHRLAPELHRIGVLTVVDQSCLGAYCTAYGRWVEADEVIAREGLTVSSPNGYRIANAAVAISRQERESMRRLMLELGLTPASRVRLAKGEPPPDDPLEQLLRRRPQRGK
jgi:P27 family predicted phage terminase small subunit